MRSIRAIILIVVAMTPIVRAESGVSYSDGKTHSIDSTLELVRVGTETPSASSISAATQPTRLRFLHRAWIQLLDCRGDSIVDLTDGAIHSSHLRDHGVCHLSGAAVNVLNAMDQSRTIVDGGTVEMLHVWQSADAKILGGATAILDVFDRGSVSIGGGSVALLQPRGESHVDVSGGRVDLLNGFGATDVRLTGGAIGSALLTQHSHVTLAGATVESIGFSGESVGLVQRGSWGRGLGVSDNAAVDAYGGTGGSLSVTGGTLRLHGTRFSVWCLTNASASPSGVIMGDTRLVGTLADGSRIDVPLVLMGGTLELPNRFGQLLTINQATVSGAATNVPAVPTVALVSPESGFQGPDDGRQHSSPRARQKGIAAGGVIAILLVLWRNLRLRRRTHSGQLLTVMWQVAGVLLITGILVMWGRSQLSADYLMHHDGAIGREIISGECNLCIWNGPDYVVGEDGGWRYHGQPVAQPAGIWGAFAAQRDSTLFISVPYWLISLAAALVFIACLLLSELRRRKRDRAAREGRCLQCGYDLRAARAVVPNAEQK